MPQAIIDAIANAGRHGTRIKASAETQSVAELRALTAAALKLEIATPHTYKESVDLFRIGKSEIEAIPMESISLDRFLKRWLLLDSSTARLR